MKYMWVIGSVIGSGVSVHHMMSEASHTPDAVITPGVTLNSSNFFFNFFNVQLQETCVLCKQMKQSQQVFKL